MKKFLTLCNILSVSLGLVLLAATTPAHSESPRLISQVLPGTTTVVVVAEGAHEPRSIGSYSLRFYRGANPRFPYDDFIAGLIRPRNGTLERVLFADLDRDGRSDVIVVMRSAGTGGYQSADALALQGKHVLLLASVSGLSKDADPLRALQDKLAYHTAE